MENILNDIVAMQNIDRSNMMGLILNFSRHCQDACKIADGFKRPKVFFGFKNVVFSGLGGSAIGADLIRCFLEDEIKIPIIVLKEYNIPNFINKDTLFFSCSYSGDTEETLSAYKQAKAKRAKIIAITSGGKLEEIARGDKIPFVTVPSGFPPRAAVGYSFFVPLVLLSKLGIINSKIKDIKETIGVLEELKSSLGPKISTQDNLAKIIATRIHNRFCIIYGSSSHMAAVVTRWRSQFAENSKHLSSSHLLPEMNHNEIVGWENPPNLIKELVVIFLKDKDDHPRVLKRMQVSKEIINDKNQNILEVNSEGKGLLARTFSLIYIGDFVSFYLAILNNVDPTPVDKVTYLKNRLSTFN